MEAVTNLVAQGPQRSSIKRNLEDRKDELTLAIRQYQAAKLMNAGPGGAANVVEAAEDTLVEAWRTVIDLEGQLIGYKPLPGHLS
jgi:hypothetical protein